MKKNPTRHNSADRFTIGISMNASIGSDEEQVEESQSDSEEANEEEEVLHVL